MAQQVKDLALLLLWLGSLMWRRFNPWPRNFHMPHIWTKQKVKNTSPERARGAETERRRPVWGAQRASGRAGPVFFRCPMPPPPPIQASVTPVPGWTMDSSALPSVTSPSSATLQRVATQYFQSQSLSAQKSSFCPKSRVQTPSPGNSQTSLYLPFGFLCF